MTLPTLLLCTTFLHATLAPVPVQASASKGLPVTPEAYQASQAGLTASALLARWPLTVAESSGYTRSSRLADVEAFLDRLGTLPEAERLTLSVMGQTTEGRALHVVTVREGEGERVRVLVNANIHGGEIEGKVAVQILLREFALGYHADLLEALELTFVPVFNADGNDAIARTNRATQNGPDEGVGERPNAMGLDLNRDFVKLETPEVRALTALVRSLDPHAFMDLHTTNGSPHGYDLTYASSLSPNVPRDLASYMAERFFPAVAERLRERHAIHVYDYGNFEYARRAPGSRGERGDPIRWSTYDSRPRFGTNLMGIRGKVSILSEAYSYLDYERRILATYAFVLACLHQLAKDADEVRGFGPDLARREIGVDAVLDSVGEALVRVGRYDRVEIDLDPAKDGLQTGERRVDAGPEAVREVSMEVRSRFRATRTEPYTETFAVLDPSPELLEVLGLHLGDLTQLSEPLEATEVSVFVIEAARRSDRVFQGHREASVEGSWELRQVVLPAGTLLVEASPLAAHLLHPESDDSLTTWNFFDEALFPEADSGADTPGPAGLPEKAGVLRTHPVLLIR